MKFRMLERSLDTLESRIKDREVTVWKTDEDEIVLNGPHMMWTFLDRDDHWDHIEGKHVGDVIEEKLVTIEEFQRV